MGDIFKPESFLIKLKGKDYLQVAHRVLWFRQHHPEWTIETELVQCDEKSATAKATIRNHDGRIIATSHKFEDAKGFGDFREKAETGAVGRALALCGFGTQFAQEFDEGPERIVDSPQASPRPNPAKDFLHRLNTSPKPETITKDQYNELLEKSEAFGWKTNEISDYLFKNFGVARAGELTVNQYRALMDAIEHHPKKG